MTLLLNMCGNVADVAVTVNDSADPSYAPRELAYTIEVMNNGPDPSGVRLFVSTTGTRVETTRGHCRPRQGSIPLQVFTECEFNLGADASDNRATVTLASVPRATFTASVTATATATVDDPAPANNSETETTEVFYVGADGFRIQTGTAPGVALTWRAGDAQAGYFVGRRVGSTTTIFPDGDDPFPPATASFTDPSPVPGEFNCYVVSPVDSARQAYGISIMLCAVAGTATSINAPDSFSVGMPNAKMARVEWSGPGTQTGYVLNVYPLDGSPSRSQSLAGNAESLLDETGGVPTCYVLVPLNGTAPIGHSDPLCVLPQIGTLLP